MQPPWHRHPVKAWLHGHYKKQLRREAAMACRIRPTNPGFEAASGNKCDTWPSGAMTG